MERSFTVNLPNETIRIMKVHCAEREVPIKAFLNLAILKMLENYKLVEKLK
jgi:hypothetical protein